MALKTRIRKDRAGVDGMIAAGGVLLVVCLLIVAGIAIAGEMGADDDMDPIAKKGSRVEVDYVGTFLDGRVFDTSLLEVAEDSSRPKSLDFNMRSPGEYRPLSVHIGQRQMLAGFEDAIIGLMEGESTVVTLTAAEAYGEVPEDEISEFELVQTVAGHEVMSVEDYEALFGEEPATGIALTHPQYGWESNVVQVEDGEVTLHHIAKLGDVYSVYTVDGDDSYGWQIKVTSLAGGEIEFENLLNSGQVNKVRGKDADGTFYLLSLDEDDNKFSVKRSREVVGQTLTFEITLVSILS